MANTYPPEVKAQVIAEWRSGVSDRALEAKYNIPRSTIRNWTGNLGDVRVTPEKKEDIDARIIDLTLTGIETLESILRHARNPAWLENQNAHDLAFFFGITVDKFAAILAAYERGLAGQAANAGGTGAGQIVSR